MTSSPIKLIVHETPYDLGRQEFSCGSGDLDTSADWAKLSRFLRAVADTLDDGYTLRKAPREEVPADGDR